MLNCLQIILANHPTKNSWFLSNSIVGAITTREVSEHIANQIKKYTSLIWYRLELLLNNFILNFILHLNDFMWVQFGVYFTHGSKEWNTGISPPRGVRFASLYSFIIFIYAVFQTTSHSKKYSEYFYMIKLKIFYEHSTNGIDCVGMQLW